jgi:hypothetical protein
MPLGRERYYVDEGKGHDDLLRCKDCQSLVTFVTIQKIGACGKCGNKRFSEITLLSQEEMDAIQSGEIDFPSRDLFLEEFAAVAGS